MQIKLSILDSAKTIEENKLKQLIRDHFSYFNDIINCNKGKKLKKRFQEEYQLTNNISQLLIQMITKLFHMIIKEQGLGLEEKFRQKILHIAKNTLQETPTARKNDVQLLNTQQQGAVVAKEAQITSVTKPISNNALYPVIVKIGKAKEDSNATTSMGSIKHTTLPPQLNNIIQEGQSKTTLDQKKITVVQESPIKSIPPCPKSNEEITRIIEELAKKLKKENVATKIELLKIALTDDGILPEQKIVILQEISIKEEDRRRDALIDSSAANSLIAGKVIVPHTYC